MNSPKNSPKNSPSESCRRVSRSLVDPLLTPAVPVLYRVLPIPHRFPPEGIVLVGHLLAICGAVGFAFSVSFWWGGVLAAVGVAGNHLADMLDGTHARRTGQCRNGGELLDHFTDPLSFTYWMIGLAVACQRPWLGLAGVVSIYALALLTNIKAKICGEFSLARFGPTEFKLLLAVYGSTVALLGVSTSVATSFLAALVAVGILSVGWSLFHSVRQVNDTGPRPDTSDWQLDPVHEGSRRRSRSDAAVEHRPSEVPSHSSI